MIKEINIIEGLPQGNNKTSISGRDKGDSQRLKFNLDELDKSPNEVKIVIPPNIQYISGSFLLGLFGESIRYYGSGDKFLSKYRFSSSLSSVLKRCIDEAICDALKRNGALG